MSKIHRYSINKAGRDYIIGDIHGCFSDAFAELKKIGFNPEADRLFSVGDLVDRGPESEESINWIALPWFHAVQGNHDDYAIRWPNGNMDTQNYIRNGGAWNVFQSPEQSLEYSDAFRELPIAIEIETKAGLIGIVHADCPLGSWTDFAAALHTGWVIDGNGGLTNSKWLLDQMIDKAQWSRSRFDLSIQGHQFDDVSGVRAVVVGHSTVNSMLSIGNVLYIDTGAYADDGYFTIIDAATLEKVN